MTGFGKVLQHSEALVALQHLLELLRGYIGPVDGYVQATMI